MKLPITDIDNPPLYLGTLTPEKKKRGAIALTESLKRSNMDNNEIKKALYKEKPYAKIHGVTKAGIRYEAEVSGTKVSFLVPLSDIGDASFLRLEPAQLLIRYLITGNTPQTK